ncbi:MAG TPA: BON domain-containing protein [Methylomirabilota bacterium]
MIRVLLVLTAATAAMTLNGCTLVVLGAYDMATDARPLAVQSDDGAIANTIRSELLEAGLRRFLAVDVFCHQGLVVLTGIAEPGSDAAARAIAIARRQPGVRRVETYFFSTRLSRATDYGISTRFLGRVIFDLSLRAAQVDFVVINGHVVLAGVVDGQPRMEAILRHARSVDGVKTVRSYLQLKAAHPKAALGRR